MASLETTIRQHLVSYLADEESLDDFTEWLVGATWNVDSRGETGASQLTYAIELALAEASSGLLTQDELRDELRTLVKQVDIDSVVSQR